jgi:aminocarboxymuconate-semialdehyde decarboxylase
MAGVQLGSNVNGVYLGDRRFRPIWQAIADLHAAVFVHPVNLIGSDRLGDYFLANLIGNPVDSTRSIADVIFSGLLEELPGLKVCFAHAGGAAPYLLGRWDHGFEKRPSARGNISRPPSEYFKLLYFDHIAHSDAALRFLIDLVGANHVMIGTDYPFDMGPDDPVGFVESMSDLSPEEKNMIRSDNARDFLGISK